MARKYLTAPIHVPPTPVMGPVCPCRFDVCDRSSPYCDVSRLAKQRGAASPGSAELPACSLSEEYRREFDARAEFQREEAKRKVAASDPGSPPPRRKRRTKEQMAAFRAELAAKQQAVSAAVTPSWLSEPDELLEAILRAPHEDP